MQYMYMIVLMPLLHSEQQHYMQNLTPNVEKEKNLWPWLDLNLRPLEQIAIALPTVQCQMGVSCG